MQNSYADGDWNCKRYQKKVDWIRAVGKISLRTAIFKYYCTRRHVLLLIISGKKNSVFSYESQCSKQRNNWFQMTSLECYACIAATSLFFFLFSWPRPNVQLIKLQKQSDHLEGMQINVFFLPFFVEVVVWSNDRNEEDTFAKPAQQSGFEPSLIWRPEPKMNVNFFLANKLQQGIFKFLRDLFFHLLFSVVFYTYIATANLTFKWTFQEQAWFPVHHKFYWQVNIISHFFSSGALESTMNYFVPVSLVWVRNRLKVAMSLT